MSLCNRIFIIKSILSYDIEYFLVENLLAHGCKAKTAECFICKNSIYF